MSDVLEPDPVQPEPPGRTFRARQLDAIVQELAEGLRASLASIRAAIETMTEYPDMDEAVRAQFAEIVRQGAVEASARLEASMGRYAEAAAAERPMEAVPAATVLHRAADALADDGLEAVRVAEPGALLPVRADRAALAGVLVFLGQRVRHAARATEVDLSARAAGRYVALDLAWEGAPIQPVRLERWLALPLGAAPDRTAADVLERHDAEVWARASGGRAVLQVLVPGADA